MNAKQRRVYRRKMTKKTKYVKGDSVRIHHRLKEIYNTKTEHFIVSVGWGNNKVLYLLDEYGGKDFDETMLTDNTTSERRKIDL